MSIDGSACGEGFAMIVSEARLGPRQNVTGIFLTYVLGSRVVLWTAWLGRLANIEICVGSAFGSRYCDRLVESMHSRYLM
jgi:hypothetical protein